MTKSKSVSNPITGAAVARVQSAVATQHGGGVPKGNYVGRMQRAVAQTQPKSGNSK